MASASFPIGYGAKDNRVGSLKLRLETSEGVAGVIYDLEFYQLSLDYLDRYPGIVKSITKEQIREAARRYIQPQSFVQVIAGPYKEEGWSSKQGPAAHGLSGERPSRRILVANEAPSSRPLKRYKVPPSSGRMYGPGLRDEWWSQPCLLASGGGLR